MSAASALLEVTPKAIETVAALAREENRPARLRIAIEGGGCSGFRYHFTFENEAADDDHVIQADGLDVIVDPISAMYLQGAVLSYEETLSGSQLTLRNPQAKSTCGCGQSFEAVA
jgi:iron-sulfur cluster insertion protein